MLTLLQEAQQNSLLDMEMADYERLVKELNAKLSERDERAEELKTQINTLTQKEDTLKREIGMDGSHWHSHADVDINASAVYFNVVLQS